MKTTDLRNNIEKVIGNNIRCLLPSYWWKRLFHQVADTIDTINGVEIVESEAKLKNLDAQQGSLASVATRKEMKISECYFPTEEDESLSDAELFAKLTPLKAIKVNFPLPDLSSADTALQLVSEDLKNLGFLMLGKGLCTVIFTDVAAGTQKYWILTGQFIVDAVNNFLKEKKFYILDDRENIGEENMALFDSVFTIVDSNTDVYVKGMSWERLAKEGESGSGSTSVPSYTLYYTTYKVNGVTTMADKYINLNKEEYAKIIASQKAKENYLLQVVELGSSEEYAPVDVELSWFSIADLNDTDGNFNVTVCSFLQKDGANQPQRRLVSFKSDGTAEYELMPTGDVKFLYYADGVNSLSAKEKAHNASAILSIKNSFDSSFTPSPIIIRYKIDSTKYLSLQGILSGNDAEGDGVSLTAFASQNVYYRFNYDLATGEPAKAELIKTVDSELSTTSENPLQNKVVTAAINDKADKSDIKTINGVSLLGGGNLQLGDGETIVYDDTDVKKDISDLKANDALQDAELAKLSYDLEKEVENLAPIEGILTKAEIDIKGELKDGYYALNGSGFVAGGGSYLSTDLLRVTPQEILRVKSWVTSSIVASISFYDINKIPLVSEFRGKMEQSTIEVVVPNDAYYIAVCCINSNTYSLEVWANRKILNAYTKEEVDALHAQVQGLISPLKEDVDFIAEKTLAEESENIVIETYDYKQDGSNGYWASTTANFNKDDSRRATQKLSVNEGQSYLITTIIRPTSISAVVFYDENNNNVGRWRTGTGTEEHLVDEILIIPQGVAYIAVNSASPISPSVKLVAEKMVFAAYTKGESDVRYEKRGGSVTKYGLSWSLEDYSELGKREFGSVGTSAVSAIGNADGYSDYDNIYPWSEMRRCNLHVTDNGAKVVVYEGEEGFALDGSNGDVFVRIPKFKTNRYTQDGRMYVVIGEGYTHPLFIENGVELDEVFVGAFESSVVENKMYSRSNVIPTNNIIGADFLDAAKARGNGYTLFDMRAIDAIWRLMAVEYGCRNSNRIIGYGYSDYRQAVSDYDYLIANQNISQSNIIKLNASTSASIRAIILSEFATGNNILFCKENQRNILAERKITNVEYDDATNEVVITFDGTPIDITTDIFVGNAPCDCNYCETISQEYAMGWHTGRTNRPPLGGTGKPEIAMNPCRYRWIENPVGNVWHMLPDVKFFDGQMYMCNDIMSYNFNENKDNYIPYGNILPLQTSNGIKSDVNTSTTHNYWMTKMMNDTFAKGSAFAKSFDTEHNGLLSSQGFGGYYYLNNGFMMIVAGGGFDHLWRSNILTFRAWYSVTDKWYLYGARLMFKNIVG